MSEDIEKSLEERIEDARLEQILDIQTGASSSEVCDRHRWEHEGIIDENIKEHVEECLGEMLNNYIEDERNYIVDGAIIKCDRMSDKKVTLRVAEDVVDLFGEGGEAESKECTRPGVATYYDINAHVGEENIRKLKVVSGNYQLDNGIPFATVIDRTCLREEEKKLESKTRTGMNAILAKQRASIVSCGNCKIIKDEDIKEIVENLGKVRKYGTCYLFIKPDLEWINPYCMESAVGKCEGERLMSPLPSNADNALKLAGDVANNAIELAVCAIEHHKTMRFSTTEGEKEGLTMLSTLLCTRGGVITIEAPGQIYIDPKTVNEEVGDIEERIKRLVNSVEGKSVDSSEELKGLSTMEILSRLIYQEDRSSQKGQNAVLFSIVNRLFSTRGFVLERKNNNIYSVIVDCGQYDSIENDTAGEYSGFRPPAKEESDESEEESDESEEVSELEKDSFASEEESWENAKKLAAILYIAIEDYGEPCKYHGENEREENVVIKGDDETYQEVLSFIQQQENAKHNLIINEIGTRDSLNANPTGRNGEEQYGGNYFFWY